MKATSILAALALATTAIAPTSAFAQSSAHEYAEAQCGNGGYAEKGYASYAECYEAAVEYYYYITSGGGGGGGTGAKTRTSRVVRTKVPRVVVEIANWPVEVSGEDAVALVIGV